MIKQIKIIVTVLPSRYECNDFLLILLVNLVLWMWITWFQWD